jgi:uncharacterized protein (TIGR02118 family)
MTPGPGDIAAAPRKLDGPKGAPRRKAADWALEICAAGEGDAEAAAREWFARDGLPFLLSHGGAAHVDVYWSATAAARDPFTAASHEPLVFVIACFRSCASLHAAMDHVAFREWVEATPHGLALTTTPLRVAAFPVDEPRIGGCAAPHVYVVRYYGPRKEASGFAAHYERTHPPLLARLPRIRAIACYRPAAKSAPARCNAADYLIGNEVEFDCAEDFNAAMASPARATLRADFEALPRVFRDNRHFAMRRERHYPPR